MKSMLIGTTAIIGVFVFACLTLAWTDSHRPIKVEYFVDSIGNCFAYPTAARYNITWVPSEYCYNKEIER